MRDIFSVKDGIHERRHFVILILTCQLITPSSHKDPLTPDSTQYLYHIVISADINIELSIQVKQESKHKDNIDDFIPDTER